MKKKDNRGGLRPSNPGGRPKKAGKRVTVSVCLDPDNLEYRKQIGRGWNDLVNKLVKNQTKVAITESFERLKTENIKLREVLETARRYAIVEYRTSASCRIIASEIQQAFPAESNSA